jgi:hypothetical protein
MEIEDPHIYNEAVKQLENLPEKVKLELIASIKEADAQIDRGEGITFSSREEFKEYLMNAYINAKGK